MNYEEQEELQKEVARRCHPEWSEEEVQAEAAKEIRRQRNYEEELRCWLLRADDLKEDPSWFWCDTCGCIAITCEHCNNSSCNASGCPKDSEFSDECHTRFMKATALSWANKGGSLDEKPPQCEKPPQWYSDLYGKLETENSSEICEICRAQRLAFAKAMILNREEAQNNISSYTCEEHQDFLVEESPLVNRFFAQIILAESVRDGKFNI